MSGELSFEPFYKLLGVGLTSFFEYSFLIHSLFLHCSVMGGEMCNVTKKFNKKWRPVMYLMFSPSLAMCFVIHFFKSNACILVTTWV